MKITNKQFVEQYMLSAPAAQMLEILTVIKKLVVSRQLQKISRLSAAQEDPMISDVIAVVSLLQHYGKANIADLSALMRIVQQNIHDAEKIYTVSASSSIAANRVDERMHTKNSRVVEQQESEQVGLIFTGDKRMYKRTLSNDLHKLLG